jgi:broad specificity phosphatase PhoE
MRRTLQTAEQSLGWLIQKGVPVILRAEWQENSAKPCDTGTSISEMQKEWPQFDWSTVDPLYPSKKGLYEFSKRGLTQRGIEARKWLRARPEKTIIVVSHSGFLRVGVSHRMYDNADYRIFDFGEGDEDVGGRLVEWEETESNGGGLGKSQKGIMVPGDLDYPPEEKEIIEESTGEAVKELPN